MTKYLGFPKYAEIPCGIPETFATAYTGTSSYWNQDVSFFWTNWKKEVIMQRTCENDLS